MGCDGRFRGFEVRFKGYEGKYSDARVTGMGKSTRGCKGARAQGCKSARGKGCKRCEGCNECLGIRVQGIEGIKGTNVQVE